MVVTVPSALSTELVVVAALLLLPLLQPPEQPEDESVAVEADVVRAGEIDAPTLLIALMLLTAFRLDRPSGWMIALKG